MCVCVCVCVCVYIYIYIYRETTHGYVRMLCCSPHCSSSHVLTQMAAVWLKLYSVEAKMCNNVHCCNREKTVTFNWGFGYKKHNF